MRVCGVERLVIAALGGADRLISMTMSCGETVCKSSLVAVELTDSNDGLSRSRFVSAELSNEGKLLEAKRPSLVKSKSGVISMSRGVRAGEREWLHKDESVPYCEFNRAIWFCVVTWSTPVVSAKSGTGGRLGDR